MHIKTVHTWLSLSLCIHLVLSDDYKSQAPPFPTLTPNDF